jgi:quercetin dioxygenase-like cupin family protein
MTVVIRAVMEGAVIFIPEGVIHAFRLEKDSVLICRSNGRFAEGDLIKEEILL